jgi:hypothetical protein
MPNPDDDQATISGALPPPDPSRMKVEELALAVISTRVREASRWLNSPF